jgi:ADP-ribose pyrophosphatase YjhB (NUDIX family)
MSPLFGWSKENPFHVSVGAVLQREDGKVCCHRFGDVPVNPIRPHNVYLLMRETIEANESLEAALARGLMEEFGAVGKPVRFLGTLLTKHRETEADVEVEKATLYVLCELISQNIADRHPDDEERASVLEWLEVPDLIAKIEKHHELLQRDDLYEVPILNRL